MDHEEHDERINRLLSLASSSSSLGGTSPDRYLYQSGHPAKTVPQHFATNSGDSIDHAIDLLSLHSSLSSLEEITPSMSVENRRETLPNATRIKWDDDSRKRTDCRSQSGSAEQRGRHKGSDTHHGETEAREESERLDNEELQWVCDFCKNAVFSDFWEAQTHENECRSKQQQPSPLHNFEHSTRHHQGEKHRRRSSPHRYCEVGGEDDGHHIRSAKVISIASAGRNQAPWLSRLPNHILKSEAADARQDSSEHDSSAETTIAGPCSNLELRLSSLREEIRMLQATEAREDYNEHESTSPRRLDEYSRKHDVQLMNPQRDSYPSKTVYNEKPLGQLNDPHKQLPLLSSLKMDHKPSGKGDTSSPVSSHPKEQYSKCLSRRFDCRKISEKEPPTETRHGTQQPQKSPDNMGLPRKDAARQLPTLSSLQYACRKISEKERDLQIQTNERRENKVEAKPSANHFARLSSLTFDFNLKPGKRIEGMVPKHLTIPVDQASSGSTKQKVSWSPSDFPDLTQNGEQRWGTRETGLDCCRPIEDKDKKWVCDSCKSAKFKSYAACYIHEKVCSTDKSRAGDVKKPKRQAATRHRFLDASGAE
eukprot:scaffold1376_cov125-Cylindrotheca_fusiformis.AAC.14